MGREGPPACQETGSQSSASKERGEKAPLPKAGPIPAELCLPSQSGSGGQAEGHLDVTSSRGLGINRWSPWWMLCFCSHRPRRLPF